MPTLHIEHPIRDYDTWKAAFARDPAGRQLSGVGMAHCRHKFDWLPRLAQIAHCYAFVPYLPLRAGRQRGGVRRYRILRPTDNPNYVMIDLDFDTLSEAEAFLAALHRVWQSPHAAPALAGSPQTRIVETVESKEY